MDNEFMAFFMIIMKDLDDRQRMWENHIKRKPEEREAAELRITLIRSIKILNLNRARTFGLVVNSEAQELANEEAFGVMDVEAHKLQISRLSKDLVRLGEC
ncbi:TPA: hypothetical protein ACGUPM_002684 [Vibrio vulnificus]